MIKNTSIMSFAARLLMAFAVRHIEVFFEVGKKLGISAIG
jgi:hypothetical protein